MYSYKPFNLIESATCTPELRDASKSFEEMVWKKKHELDKPLFHYTTLEGLMGILETRSIWLSEIRCFKDAHEFQYGMSVISKAIDEAIQGESDRSVVKFLKQIPEMLALHADIYHVFVACFCEDGSLLSQWREYANNGGGYALQLEFSGDTCMALSPKPLEPYYQPRLLRVIYNPEEQRECLRAYLDLLSKAAGAAFSGWCPRNDAEFSPRSVEVINPLMDLLVSFKHAAYEGELEWRVVYFKLPDCRNDCVQFKTDNSVLKPYLPGYVFDNTPDGLIFPLKRINFGPALDVVHTKAATELLLLKHANSEHPIKLGRHMPISGAGFVSR